MAVEVGNETRRNPLNWWQEDVKEELGWIEVLRIVLCYITTTIIVITGTYVYMKTRRIIQRVSKIIIIVNVVTSIMYVISNQASIVTKNQL